MSNDCSGFDNDRICVLNVCSFADGASCKFTTVTVADSPYSTLSDDVFIRVDASGGNITINLTTNSNNLNQKYFFKRIDGTSNTVTIFPHAGGTIDSGVSYNLPRQDEIVSFCRNGTDWEVTNEKLDRVLTTKGDLFVHDGTTVRRLPRGTDGQFLQTDSTQTLGLKWTAAAGSASPVTYSLLTLEAVAKKITYVSIGYFPWLNSRYSSYTNGTVIFRATAGTRDLDVRLYDITNSTTLGSLTGVTTTGSFSFAVSNPSSDAQIALQIKKSANGGINPRIFGTVLEFDA